MNYIFKSTTTMKEYNAKKWWIDSNIIPEMRISADNLNEAIKKFAERATNDHYVRVSKNAIKNKNPMYVDTTDGGVKQVGYVITGNTDFELNNYKWVSQYVDIWVEIITVSDTEF